MSTLSATPTLCLHHTASYRGVLSVPNELHSRIYLTTCSHSLYLLTEGMGTQLTTFLISVFAVNALITGLILSQAFSSRVRGPSATREYSYLGNDFPLWFGESPKLAEMTFEESIRYSMDGPDADVEWRAMRDYDGHAGYVRLGPSRRVFAVSMFHQLHCVNSLRVALVRPDDGDANFEHVHHCFTYLRQALLCAADSTLEPFDFVTKNYTMQPVSHTRVCKDWGSVYEAAGANFQQWVDWKEHYSKPHRPANDSSS